MGTTQTQTLTNPATATPIPEDLREDAATIESFTNLPTFVQGVEQDSNGDIMYVLHMGVFQTVPLLKEQLTNITSEMVKKMAEGLLPFYSVVNMTKFKELGS